jgi:hypothetical protein
VPLGGEIQIAGPDGRIIGPFGLEKGGVRHLPVLLDPLFYRQQLK